MLWLLHKSLNIGRSALRLFWLSKPKQRKHNKPYKYFDLARKKMAQAKTLNEKELRKVLNYIALRKHAPRNRAMLLVTHWSGMRVGEVSALRIGDVVAADGSIKDEVRLSAEQTKGDKSRTVFLPEKLRKELSSYISLIKTSDPSKPLFKTQKRDGFSANTLTQHFHYLYKKAGVYGASSHSGRRTFITELANKGVGVRVLMALAGHRNISTTQAYIDLNDGMKRRAVELI